MATIDNILGNPSGQKRVAVSPPPIDGSLSGAPNSVGSLPIENPTKHETQQTGQSQTTTTAQTEKPKMSYVELFQAMNPYKLETAEERAKREKREKRDKIIAAVGDGISALSNLFFTTKYAPNAYNASQGMSAKAKARWDKLKAEREANQQAYFNGYLKAKAMDDAQDKDDRNWRHTLEREEIADQYRESKERRDEAKADRDALLAEAKLEYQMGKLDYQGYQNEIARIKAEYQPQLIQSAINKNNRTGTSTTGGGSERPGEYPWYDAEGELHYAHSYEAMRQNAILAGTWEEATQQSTRVKTSPKGRNWKKETTVTTTPAKGSSKKPQKQENNASGWKGKGY